MEVAISASKNTMAATRSFQMLLIITFFQWPFSGVERIIGFYTKNSIFQSASISDAVAFGLAMTSLIYLSLSRPRISNSSAAIITIVSFLVIQLFTQYIFTSSVISNSWNSPQEEISRTIVIFSIYIVFSLVNPINISINQARKCLKYILFFGYISLAISVLQSLDVLPNFFFQWYSGSHIARPTGGFSHPHYFGAVSVLSAASAVALAKQGAIKSSLADLTFLMMGLAVVVSTSRVALFFYAAVAFVYIFYRLKGKPGLFFIISVTFTYLLVLIVLISWLMSGENSLIEKYIDVFLQPFSEENDLFRGRGELWSTELEYIFSTNVTTLFGYGYQPFVSHNLFLRQLQVSGIVGTILYVMLIFAIAYRGLRLCRPSYRIYMVMAWIPIFIASFTLPVLVAVTLNAALAVFMIAVVRLSAEDAAKIGPESTSHRKIRHRDWNVA